MSDSHNTLPLEEEQSRVTTRRATPKGMRKIDLLSFMEKNFSADMSMSEFAKASGRSLSTFKRDFKKISVLSPERWLTDHRLRAAHDKLAHGSRVSDVCFDVGFKNVSHFSAIFKKKYGKTPGEVRKGL